SSFTPDATLTALALAVGRVLGAHLLGVDVLRTPDGPAVADVHGLPGCRGADDAPALVSARLREPLAGGGACGERAAAPATDGRGPSGCPLRATGGSEPPPQVTVGHRPLPPLTAENTFSPPDQVLPGAAEQRRGLDLGIDADLLPNRG